MEAQIAFRAPLNWTHTLHFFRTRAIESVEWVDDQSYNRTFLVDGRTTTLNVTKDSHQDVLLLKSSQRNRNSITNIVRIARDVFDVDADFRRIASVLRQDSAIRGVVRKHPGIRVPGAWSWFEIAIRAVLGQQITVQAARTIAGRIVKKIGTSVSIPEGSTARLFPSPQQFLEASLSGFGIPQRRIETMRLLAKSALQEEIPNTPNLPLEEVIRYFHQFPGIGPWTAHYIALRAFRNPDVFLPGDIGLLRAASRLLGKSLNNIELLNYAERWRPWRSYAVIYLWASLGMD